MAKHTPVKDAINNLLYIVVLVLGVLAFLALKSTGIH
jgi:hypothetical protein